MLMYLFMINIFRIFGMESGEASPSRLNGLVRGSTRSIGPRRFVLEAIVPSWFILELVGRYFSDLNRQIGYP